MHIRIGNQTAISAGSPERPFAFALDQGFDAFEWFPDRNEAGAGWTEDDLGPEQRAVIREKARVHDLRLSVHAPWWANPLKSGASTTIAKSLALAEDLGADLLNLHLYCEQSAAAFVRAHEPLLDRLAATPIRLAVENTPLTGPQECNALFEALARSGRADPDRVGLCFDLGHANLCRATHNDYLKFLDLLHPDLPIIHLHLHENWGDRDSHLPLFTGPAGRDPSGVAGLLQRLARRGFSGSIILEQWPDPPSLLATTRDRLLTMIAEVEAVQRSRRSRSPAPLPEVSIRSEDHEQPPTASAKAREAPAPDAPATGRGGGREFLETLVAADRRNLSWREKLGWVRDVLNRQDPASDLENLVYLAIYLHFIGTRQVPCREDGRHFRPSHHAGLAREIAAGLAALTTPQNVSVVRRILPWLPSSDSQFTRSEPLTLIRDIAHRNDIPGELKREIKHTLQNKLHRCAGPEDLATSAALLARITAPDAAYAPAFVAEFQHFHEQLKEFFNARSLDEQLAAVAADTAGPDAGLIRSFLEAKAASREPPLQLDVLRLLTSLRARFQERLKARSGTDLLQDTLADIRLEEYAFVLLSQLINHLDGQGASLQDRRPDREAVASGGAARENTLRPGSAAAGRFWPSVLECLLLTVENLRYSGFDPEEGRALEAELAAWQQDFEPFDRDRGLRLKATLDRTRRLADRHRDRILSLFPPRASRLGRALGVPEAAVTVYAESEIRSHLVFQLAKLLALALTTLRLQAGLPRWEVIVPGRAFGRVVQAPDLAHLPGSQEAVVALIDRLQGDEEVPPQVAGVMVSQATPYLSHFAVRAREHGVVFVAGDDPEWAATFLPLAGQPAVLQASPDTVTLTPATDEGRPSLAAHRSKGRPSAAGVPAVTSVQERGVLPLDRVTAANAGGKAYGARALEAIAGRAGANFRTPASLVIPFGTMDAALHSQPAVAEEFQDRLERLDDLPPEARSESLARLQELIRGLSLPEAVVSGIVARFGAGARLMVRSSANCEDLAAMPAAGLYQSVANVTVERVAEAVREVWASLWSPRAAISRKQAGIAHHRAFMAVLIQELVAPDLSFILHTVNPVTGNPEELLAELVVGLGETLAAADRPGNPYRLVAHKSTGKVRTLAFANLSEAVFPGAAGGTVTRVVDYSKVAFSTDAALRQTLGRQLTAAGKLVEEALAAPQDIEGVLAGETLTLVQSRPQQGLV